MTNAARAAAWSVIDEDLTGRDRCASHRCRGTPVYRFEAGGVGSVYCSSCRARIEGALHVGPAVMFMRCGGRERTHGTTVIRLADWRRRRMD